MEVVVERQESGYLIIKRENNYLFYKNPETQVTIRIGYDYPIIGKKNVIFEICYTKPDINWWIDVTPDFRRPEWRDVSDLYN